MSTAISCDCPLRNCQRFAAANPAAAMLTCAAAATRNEDGSCGSSPVSGRRWSAARSPPVDVQRSARMSRGVCMISTYSVMPGLVPGIHVFFVHNKQDVDGRDKPGHDEFNTLALSRP